jgi:hypothetical protein
MEVLKYRSMFSSVAADGGREFTRTAQAQSRWRHL